ncbi:TNF receptor-associated factor 4-like [Anneissia japonica]|uniref:TNF receptor-associated factor 4-like n=1 Tax=Anneissia japonica TaxID=1529436 RepID=UPI0014254B4D|nr:TNF receptor-associated factor 4-like [Anneissia japonica]
MPQRTDSASSIGSNASSRRSSESDDERPDSAGSDQSRAESADSNASDEEAENDPCFTKIGGVAVYFEEPFDKKYECVACNQILRFPVQFEECGHRCCSSCLPELLRISPKCPLDEKSVSRDKVYVDTSFGREIGDLPIKCYFHKKGCDWKGVLDECKDHSTVCKYIEVECPNTCGAKFEKRFLDSHLSDECNKRMITCEFCQKTVFYKDEITHLNSCLKFPVPCPNGCDLTDIPREKLKNHTDTDCPKEKIECPFSSMGCDFKTERQKMQRHVQDDSMTSKHVTMVGATIVKHQATLDKQVELMDIHKETLGQCMQKVRDLEKLYGSQLVWKVDRYAERMQDAKTGKKITIFSPPFLTSRHGYKMAVSLCLNGDGKAKGHFMSVFICICRGEYDALVPYPFTHRVTFSLIDQCQDPKARRNISYSIKPNPCKENKPFLGRPQGERNASFGTQKFVPLHTLKTLDYIRDDTMFIKVHVDHDDNMCI